MSDTPVIGHYINGAVSTQAERFSDVFNPAEGVVQARVAQATVQTVDPADATPEFAEELLAWLRDKLTHYKCPRTISFEAELPRTDTGKLYKQGLINKYS